MADQVAVVSTGHYAHMRHLLVPDEMDLISPDVSTTYSWCFLVFFVSLCVFHIRGHCVSGCVP